MYPFSYIYIDPNESIGLAKKGRVFYGSNNTVFQMKNSRQWRRNSLVCKVPQERKQKKRNLPCNIKMNTHRYKTLVKDFLFFFVLLLLLLNFKQDIIQPNEWSSFIRRLCLGQEGFRVPRLFVYGITAYLISSLI